MKRLMMTVTEVMFVDVDNETAERILPYEQEYGGRMVQVVDGLDQGEAATRFRRIAAHGVEHVEVSVDFEEVDRDETWGLTPVDGIDGRERYLWSARHFVMKARQELSSGRYREGHCPDLDRVNGALARLEDELRLMALAIDHPDMPEVKAWLAGRAS